MQKNQNFKQKIMSTTETPHVCPVENAGMLEHNFRRKLQNPEKILQPYLKPGMTALDVGCGPGYFTFAMSELVGKEGKVIAADLQQGMLDIIEKKIGLGLGLGNIHTQLCNTDTIVVKEKVDFALCFYMVHEVPDRKSLLKEVAGLLNPGGTLLIVEPKIHVNKKAFNELLTEIEETGLKISGEAKVFFSRGVVCKR